MKRVLIIGCSGSGKSTLARKIVDECGLPYYDTDSMYWKEDGTLASDDEVVSRIPLDDDEWVLDGNFVTKRDEVWGRADTIIWIDKSRWKTMYQVVKRNLGWWLKRESGWAKERMSLARALSGIRHSWKRYPQVRDHFPQYLEEQKHAVIWRIRNEEDYKKVMRDLG